MILSLQSKKEGATAAGDDAITSKEEAATGEDNASEEKTMSR